MTLITAKKAFAPYREELGPQTISTRSIMSTSTRNSFPNIAWPRTLLLIRWPSINTKAAHPDEAVIAVIGDIEAGHTAQDIGQSAIAEPLDLVGVDDSDRSRRIACVLHMLRGGINLDITQFFQAEIGQLLLCQLGNCSCSE